MIQPTQPCASLLLLLLLLLLPCPALPLHVRYRNSYRPPPPPGPPGRYCHLALTTALTLYSRAAAVPAASASSPTTSSP